MRCRDGCPLFFSSTAYHTIRRPFDGETAVRKKDRGILEDIIDIAHHVPVLGAVMAVVFLMAAMVFQGVIPNGSSGTNSLMAVFFWAIAGVAALAAALGQRRRRLERRQRSSRLQAQRSIHDIHRLGPPHQ